MEISPSLQALFGQFWPLLAGLAVIGLLARGSAQKRRAAQARHNAQEAARRGLQYAEPEAPGRHPDGDAGVVDEGTHRYSGRTEGVDWVIEAHTLAQQDVIGDHHHGEGQRSFTRWTAAGASTAAAGGGALLLMNLQGSAQGAVPDTGAPGNGLMAALVDRAAGLALQTYARMAYGGARVQDLVWGRAAGQVQHLPLPAGDFATCFRAFGTRPELLQRLGPPARDWLLGAHRLEVALLWDTHGLTLRWPSARIDPDQVAACAAFGAALLSLMSKPESTSPSEDPPCASFRKP
jgi:hypothetical protein